MISGSKKGSGAGGGGRKPSGNPGSSSEKSASTGKSSSKDKGTKREVTAGPSGDPGPATVRRRIDSPADTRRGLTPPRRTSTPRPGTPRAVSDDLHLQEYTERMMQASDLAYRAHSQDVRDVNSRSPEMTASIRAVG